MKKKTKISDAWLVDSYTNGHQKALAVLVKRWHVSFCEQAYYYTKDKDVAKDIAQDSWTVIMAKLNTIKDADKFGAWGKAIVSRKAIDWFNQQKKTAQHLDAYRQEEAILTSVVASNKEQELQKLNEAIVKLPVKQQQVLRLFYRESYTLKEMAEILEVSAGTVKSRLFNAREKIKTIITSD